MELPFKQTKELESQIDNFLDTVVKAVLELQEGVRAYLNNKKEEFGIRIKAVIKHEHHADDLRKRTKIALYTHSLIPESRGDVLGLLENMDDLVDDSKEILQQFEVQLPEISSDFTEGFLEVTGNSVLAVDNVVCAARCFFRNPVQVKDYLNKVDFYESEADRAGLQLKKKVFRSDLNLAHRLHLRYFADLVECLSDKAQDVGERLNIATIKRSV